MRILAAALLVSTTFVAPAFAAEISASSRVDAVTVYPQGAEVQRIAELALEPGEHTLLFAGLPGEMQAETIRIEGDSPGRIEIGSVDSKLVSVPSTAIGRAAQADRKGYRSADGRARRRSTRRSPMPNSRSAYWNSLPPEPLLRRRRREKRGRPTPRSLAAFSISSPANCRRSARQCSKRAIRQREIDRQVNDLTLKLGELAPREITTMLISVHVNVPAATSGTFKLRYRTGNAGWMPIYDARLTSPAKGEAAAKIELVRRAEVSQSTTETWDNVALTLSTARPIGATAAPDLLPQGIDGFEEGRARNFARDSESQRGYSAGQEALDEATLGAGLPAPRSVAQMEAEIAVAGFQALYGIQGRVSIDNTGTAKKVRIATDAIEAKLSARAVPKLDPNAYLTANFTIGGETPLLPGTVTLYRDGVYMGEGVLPMLSPGEATKMGFGVDDLVKVKRVEVNRTKSEEGLITTSNVDSRAYDITVKNLHDFPLDVSIFDQMPYSTNEDVTVATLSGMTPPSQANVERRRGVLAWNFDLEPKAEKVIKHGFKVTWPKDMAVGSVMD